MVHVHPLKGPNRFKLGVFSTNADGGLAITDVAERWRARWDDNLTAVGIADRAGLEFFLPIARWQGFGGKNRVREWSFETFTWAAGLAAVTRNIGLFMTVHVPLVHPVYAAKALATVDHISGGRAGLNIVCGWNSDEFAMFGAKPSGDAYEQATEWIAIIDRCYGTKQPFDFEGKHYSLRGVVSRPSSVQVPRPMTMSAALGGPGRDFAARNCDFMFSTFSNIEDGRKHVTDIRDRSRLQGREVGIYTVCHVVCRETQREADDYYEHYATTHADQVAVDNNIAHKKAFATSLDKDTLELYRKRFAGGAGTYPLIGTPEKIVDDLVKLANEGYIGAALAFVNYNYELPFFCDRVLPLMKQAGLRIV